MVGVYLLALVACIVGKCLCLTVPPQIVSKPIVILAVGLELQNAFLQVVASIMVVHAAVVMISAVASLAAPVLFLVFLRQLAWSIRRKDLSDDARGVLHQGLILVGITVGTVVLAILVPVMPLLALFSLVALLVVVIFGLIVFFRYIRLLGELSEATLRASRG
jgi:hypothetical protein